LPFTGNSVTIEIVAFIFRELMPIFSEKQCWSYAN
jgi:hypothetical protein